MLQLSTLELQQELQQLFVLERADGEAERLRAGDGLVRGLEVLRGLVELLALEGRDAEVELVGGALVIVAAIACVAAFTVVVRALGGRGNE